MAGLLLVGQYHPQLTELAAKMGAAGLSANSLGGPGSILCSFPSPTETNYGYLFFIEFFVDSFLVSSPAVKPGAPTDDTLSRASSSGQFSIPPTRSSRQALHPLLLALHMP